MYLIWWQEVACMDEHDFVVMTEDEFDLWPLLYLYADTMVVTIYCRTCLVVGCSAPKNWIAV